jgi:hypothetical protein
MKRWTSGNCYQSGRRISLYDGSKILYMPKIATDFLVWSEVHEGHVNVIPGQPGHPKHYTLTRIFKL